jgi:hypothetical protein
MGCLISRVNNIFLWRCFLIQNILNIKQKLFEGWQRRLSEKRTEIHLSDVIHCRRATCFSRLDINPHPIPPDQKKIKFFHGGIQKHQMLQELLGDEFEIEKEIVWIGRSGIKLVGHIDALHKSGVAVEFKTTESTRVIREGPYPYHVKQLKAYLSMLPDAEYGIISYLILGYYPTVKDYFPEYIIKINQTERAQILKKLEADAIELKRGILEGNPAIVTHAATDKMYLNNYGYNFLCKMTTNEKLSI